MSCLTECRSFVLRLWKSLHSAALQKQHTILDTVATELTPLPAAAVLFLEVDEKTSGDGVVMSDSFADKIQVVVNLCLFMYSDYYMYSKGCHSKSAIDHAPT